jgi:hypothetical protein
MPLLHIVPKQMWADLKRQSILASVNAQKLRLFTMVQQASVMPFAPLRPIARVYSHGSRDIVRPLALTYPTERSSQL